MKRYRKEPWIDPRVRIRASPLHGKGMFATSRIRKGEKIVVWGGKFFVTKEQADRLRGSGRMIQQIDDEVFEVFTSGEASSDPTYFMNHSCDPNVWMKDEVTLVARRDIRIGEELTADYAMWEGKEDYVLPWECRCGSTLCRKTITGRDWKSARLQASYERHFAPFINRRIRANRN